MRLFNSLLFNLFLLSLFFVPAFCPAEVPERYLESVYRVSSYMYDFTPEEMLSWGEVETDYADVIVLADPRIFYRTLTVRHRSWDYGWTQINSQNFKWVEKRAKNLQRAGQIPSNLRLYALYSPSRVDAWERMAEQNKRLVWHRGRRYLAPFIMRFECDEDCIDSFLVYRCLVERRLRAARDVPRNVPRKNEKMKKRQPEKALAYKH